MRKVEIKEENQIALESQWKREQKKEIQSMGKFADSETSPSKRNEYEKIFFSIITSSHSAIKNSIEILRKKASFPTYEHSSF